MRVVKECSCTHGRAPLSTQNPTANPQTALCVQRQANGLDAHRPQVGMPYGKEAVEWACWAACGSGGVERSRGSWTTHQPGQRVVDAPKVHRKGRNPECCGVAGADEVSKVKAERQAAKAEGLRLALGGTTGCGGARAGEPTERERQNTAQKWDTDTSACTGMRVRGSAGVQVESEENLRVRE